MNKQNHICFVAGKSGGHILPCLTLAQRLKEEQTESSILFFSTDAALDTSLLSNQSMISHYIALSLGRFSVVPLYRHLQMAWKLAQSCIQSLYYLYKHKPKKIVSTGGLVAVPVCLAAALLRIPIELYELNAVPGKAIKILAPFARTIYVCFEQAKKYFPKLSCVHHLYPIRFTDTHKQINKEQACQELGLSIHKKTIFIMGGSQGSLQLSNAIKKYIETSSRCDNLQIIHQTGSYDRTDWQAFYASKHIQAVVFDYRDNVASCYIAADIVITRAGAGMLFEILFFEKPSIVIPLEATTTSHQIDNAYAMQAQYPTLFTVIRQQEMHMLRDYLDKLLQTSTIEVECAQKNLAYSEA